MARQGSDRNRPPGVADVREVAYRTDVDEQRRPGEPEPQQREQRVPACEELRVVVRPQQLERLVDRLGGLVVERSRDHASTSFSARQTRSGVAGIWMSVMPSS